jgi:23S rRNA (uridine2552-2'-O)-methyltransferase
MSKHKKSWMQEHVSDPFVKRANDEGWRSRAAFKLLEVIEQDRLVRPGMVVVDLGAAPGGWSQVVSQCLCGDGLVLALDILEMEDLPLVNFIQGDFNEQSTIGALEGQLLNRQVDLVISDMAPNISGIKSIDQARWLNLAELALDFARQHLTKDGGFLVMCFEGEGAQDYRENMKSSFQRVVRRKPKASRDRSSEFFLVGLNKID